MIKKTVMENSFKLESTIKIFNVMFNGVQYEVQIEYTWVSGITRAVIKDISRMDGEDYVFDEELFDYIDENL